MRSCVIIACIAVSFVASQSTVTTEKPLVRCPRVMCDMFCSSGFKTDSSGCPICDCLQDPCEYSDCVMGAKCRADTCIEHPCTHLRPICESEFPCATPMCASACPHGYATSPEGCDTCDCKVELVEACKHRDCPEGTTCETKDNGAAYCKVRPLCHEARDIWEKMQDPGMADMMKDMMGRGHMMGHMMGNPFMGRGPHMGHMMMPGPMMMGPPLCDESTGDFTPRQCHEKDRHCFCVDDRGIEIDGTRTNDVDSLRCAHNRTSSLNMDMMVKHQMNDMQAHMDGLREAMEQGLGDLMQMDQRWINIIAITPDENGIHVVSIHVVVSHDGETDLPSAANFFQRRLHQGTCQIPFNDQILLPDPESIRIEHKFDVLPPVLPDEHGPEFPIEIEEPEETSCFGLRSFGGNHRMTVIMGAFGLIIIITATTGLALAAMRRRRMALLQYQHRRFENMDTLRRNIVASNELDLQSEEKKVVVLADEAPPLEEKVSIA